MNKLLISALAVTAQFVNAAPRINREVEFLEDEVDSYYPDGTKPWSTYTYEDGNNGQLFLEVRSQVECEQTMNNIKSFFDDASNGITILPANKPEILGCTPNPGRNEFGILRLLSLPSPKCSCVAGPENTVTESLNRMCASVTGTDEADWTGVNSVFNCQSNSADIHIWKFDTFEDAGRASHCLNKLQQRQKWKAVHYLRKDAKEEWTDGWCTNWDQLPDQNQDGHVAEYGRTYFPNPIDKDDCAAKCRAHPNCKQAVFESEGYWGKECWLGGQVSPRIDSGRHRTHQPSGTKSVDHCFHPIGPIETSEDDYVCYVKTEDPQICAETAAELSTNLGQNMVCSNNKAIGPDGSCYESGSDGSSITSALEKKCKDILDISPENKKYSWITFKDAAICEASKAWRFQSRTKCNIFASCLNEVHAESLRSESPTPSPTPSPSANPTSTPTAIPTVPPPPTPKPTHIVDTISYCKSKKDSRSDCADANADYGATVCGWHTKKLRCVPWKVRKSIIEP